MKTPKRTPLDTLRDLTERNVAAGGAIVGVPADVAVLGTPAVRTGNRYRFVRVDVRLALQVPTAAAADPYTVYEAFRAALLAMPRFTVPGDTSGDTAGVFSVDLAPRGSGPRVFNYASDL